MRYLVTGGSGYVGSRLVAALAEKRSVGGVMIADLRPPKLRPRRTGFRRLDIRDAAATMDLVVTERPDVLVHLAFTIDPIRDEAAMYEVDVNGTFNALAAAASAGTPRVLVASSTMAYGAWPDNPNPIDERQPVHGHPKYVYARHSTEADRIAQLWATLHTERRMTIARICTVLGPGADSHLVRMWEEQAFFPDFGGPDPETQFIYEDDLTTALAGLLEGGHAGVFNVAGEGTMPWRECARLAGLPIRSVREESFTTFASGLWRTGHNGVEVHPSFVDFYKYPWIVSNEKLKSTLGWRPRHTSREAFELAMESRGPVSRVG